MKLHFATLALALLPGLVLAQAASAAQAETMSLEEALKYAETHAPEVRSSRSDLADADGQIKETIATGIPKVDGSVGYTHFTEIPQQLLPDFISPVIRGVVKPESLIPPENPSDAGDPPAFPVQFGQKNSVSAGVSANALLFDASFFLAVKGAKLYRNLAVRTVEQTVYQTRAKVSKAYLATLLATENKAVVDSNLRNLRGTLEETQSIYEAGFAEKLDVDRLKLSYANLEAQRKTLDQLEQVTRNLLKFQMGYPVNDSLALTTNLATALGEAREAELREDDAFSPSVRPEYATLQVADSLNAIDLRRVRAGYFPSLVGFGSFARNLQRNDLFDDREAGWLPASSVGVTLNVPIFDGTTKSAQRQRSLARQDKTRIRIEQFDQQSRLALANGRASVLNARLTLEQRNAAETLAREIYESAQIKFREGVGSSIEVKQAEGELYAAQGARLQSLYDLAVAFTDYKDALGQL